MIAAGATKDEVFKRTGQVVGLHDVSFDVREGEIFVLMGLSGSGKSTLIRLVNRLVEPTAGKVLIGGRDVAAVRRSELTTLRRKDMSMVFQSFALMPQRSAASCRTRRSVTSSRAALARTCSPASSASTSASVSRAACRSCCSRSSSTV